MRDFLDQISAYEIGTLTTPHPFGWGACPTPSYV